MSNEIETGGAELPELEGAEKALVAKYPMDGVRDVLVNKNQLAAGLDVSTTTIDKWLLLSEEERIPYVERGTNGRSYVFRLSVAYAWRQSRIAAEDAERQTADDAVSQLRFNLMGGSAADSERAKLSPKEQAELLRVEKEWILAASARREYIAASEVAEAFEAVFSTIRDGFDAAPDALARELNLGGAEVEAMTKILDEILRNTADYFQKLFERNSGEG